MSFPNLSLLFLIYLNKWPLSLVTGLLYQILLHSSNELFYRGKSNSNIIDLFYYLCSILKARLIKYQRQKLVFNLRNREAKQSVIGFYLYLNQKIVSLCPETLRIRLWLRAVPSSFITLSSYGIKGMHHWFLWQTSVAMWIKVYVTVIWSVRLVNVIVLLFWSSGKLYLLKMKCHYSNENRHCSSGGLCHSVWILSIDCCKLQVKRMCSP